MSTSKVVISSDAESESSTSPAVKLRKLDVTTEKKKKKPRTGKGSQEKRLDKYREFKNNEAFQRRLANTRDPHNLYARTTNLEELERKFQEWDTVLENGGTIFDSGEIGGSVLIEAEPLDGITRRRYTMFMEQRVSEVNEVTYSSIVSDEPEFDEDMVNMVPSSESLYADADLTEVTGYVETALKVPEKVDLDELDPLQMVVDLNEMKQMPSLIASLSDDKFYTLKTGAPQTDASMYGGEL